MLSFSCVCVCWGKGGGEGVVCVVCVGGWEKNGGKMVRGD